MTEPVDVEQLLRQCQQGHEEALGRIMQHLEQRLYLLALRACGNASMAEEATVQTFYKVWCKAGQWQGQSPAEAWIYRIAVRTVLDLQRSHRRWQKRLREAGSARAQPSDPGPAETLAAREVHERVAFELEQAIKTLSQEDRLLVHLYYDEQRRLSEIAQLLNKTQGALKMRLARARKQLRDALEDSNNAFRP